MGLDFFRRAMELVGSLPPSRPADRAHDPDQRHAARRRVVRVLRRARLPRRPQHRRPARDARRLSGLEERPGISRRGDRGVGAPAAARGRGERPLLVARGERRPSRARSTGTSGTSSERGTSSSSPSSSARHPRRSRSRTPAGPTGPVVGDSSTRRPASWSPSGRCSPSSTASSSSASSRSGCDVMSARSSSTCSTSRWAATSVCTASASTRRRAATRWPSSTTATSTPATTSWSPNICSATSVRRRWSSWSPSPRQRAFGQAKADTLPRQCVECDVRFACNGGCPKDRFAHTADGEAGLNYLCPSYLTYFRHVDAPDAGAWPTSCAPAGTPTRSWASTGRRDAATGRNDPCPCGSGRKFKACHG